MDCHKDVANDIHAHTGYHGKQTEDKPCRDCHVEHKGRDARIAEFDQPKFNHDLTDYALKDAHADKGKLKCAGCHKAGKKFRDAPGTCIGCHKKNDVHKGVLGKECQNCHQETRWKQVHFDHSKTRFALLGKHADIRCKACHAKEKYKNLPLECIGCHRKDDKHKGSQGASCEKCHDEKSWKRIRFDHDKETKFPLLGQHKDAKCEACHKTSKSKGMAVEKLPVTCIGCHKKDDTHKGRYGQKCETCHNEKDWKSITFDHERDTKYPLNGKHGTIKCVACHKTPLYSKPALKTDCLGCHKKDDKHKGRYGPKCGTCHLEKDWKTLTFNHDRDTKYPLLGGHKTAKCDSCHTGKLTDKLKTECISCHKKNDKHRGTLGVKCDTCHKESDWKTIKFDHDRDTKYPLKDRHRGVTCDGCHAGKMSDTPKICVGCHGKDDKHKRSLDTKCERCHSEASWSKFVFDHDHDTHFVLKESHRKVKCESCHVGKLAVAGESCVSCHRKGDVHAGRYGDKCETCHMELNWHVIIFNHDRDTKYPLKGNHGKVKCDECHPRKIADVQKTCMGCHKKNDVHEGRYGPRCENCHAATLWKTVVFDHDRDTKFALKDKHKTVSCDSCHRARLSEILQTCISCHRKDDVHKGRYAEKCEACHKESGWKAIGFDHERETHFALKGKHATTKCDECHEAPLYSKPPLKTDCFSCHRIDDKHEGQQGTRCESCHNEKDWKDENFDHQKSIFPLLGKHLLAECRKCHLSLRFKDAKIECVSCHVKEDVHQRLMGVRCERCHNARDWRIWDFDHNKTSFRLDGAHNDLACTDCHDHPVDTNLKISAACYTCHSIEDVHDGAFGKQCERCHLSTKWKNIRPEVVR
jgi:hypothetical protein